MKNKLAIDHINLTAKNLKESTDWYRSTFGFKTVESGTSNNINWAIIRKNDTMLCISEYTDRKVAEHNPNRDDFHQIYHYGFSINDKAEWEQILSDQKLTTYYESPVKYPKSTSWYVRDPSGHTIEVAHWENNEIKF